MFPNFAIPDALYKWFRNNIWVGQQLTDHRQDESAPTAGSAAAPTTRFHRHFKKPLLAVLIPALSMQFVWWIYMAATAQFHLFGDHIHGLPRYTLSLAMLVASFVSGASCQGGGSVTFPLISLGFELSPSVARDFSYLIQAAAMSAAAFSIFYLRLQIEFASLIYCSIGGVFGIGLCLHFVSGEIQQEFVKMYYVAIWFAFALTLFILNRDRGRTVYDSIPNWERGVVFRFNLGRHHGAINWKALVLVLGGFIGGLFSGFAANGIDICSFAILTLLFRVSEKTATPTSVILMAINTVLAFVWRFVVEHAVSAESFEYFIVSAPVAVVGAPLGAVVASYLHRKCFSRFVYIANITQLIGAFNIIKPWKLPMGLFLIVSSLVLIAVAAAVWAVVVHLGSLIIAGFEPLGDDTEKTDIAVDVDDDDDEDSNTVATIGENAAKRAERQPLLGRTRMEL